jgi:hypothetical protein
MSFRGDATGAETSHSFNWQSRPDPISTGSSLMGTNEGRYRPT